MSVERSAPRGAVFLSYASQDAEAARRIAEALRASGVEVWFDVEGGLEHGDEWDAKIRRQIKECVLFIPLVSANTQARHEGYFRIEWDLAAERARGIASGVAFILPVVIDDTREPDALVPDRFRAVRWTRLPGGIVPAEVQARFLKLWSHRTGVLKHEAVSGGPTTAGRGRKADDGADQSGSRKRNPVVLVSAMLALLALVALAVWQPWQRSDSEQPARPEPARGERAESAERATSSPSEARQLIAKAWDLMDRPDMAREELVAADVLCKQAAALDPNDPEVWAAWSFVDAWYCYHAFDNTPERREGARSKAARALKLAPSSYDARLAQANYLVREGSDAAVSLYAPEADRLLRALLQERPTDPRTLLTFAILQRNLGHAAEARRALETMAQDPAFAALAWHELAWVEQRDGDPTTALALEDRSIAIQANWLNLTGKMHLLMNWHGDLDAANVVLDQIPAVAMQEDYTASVAMRLLYIRRTPDALLRLANSIPRDWLSNNMFDGPLAWWKGLAEQQADHPAAARVHWQAALKLVEGRLADAPSSTELVAWKSRLLAGLGETVEAEKTLRLARELGGFSYALTRWTDETRLGQFEQVLDEMESEYRTNPASIWAAQLRFSPEFDPLREQPRFIALLEKMEADPRCSPKAGPAAALPVADREQVQRVESAPRSAPALSQSNGLLATPSEKSVAVLAFANLSDDKANEYFSDGISEELLNVLAKIPGLKVTARTSAFFFKGKQVPIADIAQQLGVAYVIEGSVRKQGDRVRITAQLIKAADGFPVWSDTFTRDLKDIFAVQDEIAGLVAQQLQLKLGVTKPARVVDPEAYQLVLKGRHFWTQRGEANLAIAEEAFRLALKIDANFAEAHAGIADVWMIRAWYREMDEGGGPAVAEDLERATTAAQRATELDPSLAEPYATLGATRYIQGRFDEVEAPFAHALELNPNYAMAHQWYAVYSMAVGRFDICLEEVRQASRLDPLAPIPLWTLASVLQYTGAANEAFDAAVQGLQLRPGYPPLLGEMTMAAWSSGRRDEAIAAARAIAADHSDEPRWAADANAIFVLREGGHLDEAQQLAERVFTTVSAKDYRRVLALAALGRMDEAFNLVGADLPNTALQYLLGSPIWDPVREDPRFHAMVERLGFSQENRVGRATLERMRRQNVPGP